MSFQLFDPYDLTYLTREIYRWDFRYSHLTTPHRRDYAYIMRKSLRTLLNERHFDLYSECVDWHWVLEALLHLKEVPSNPEGVFDVAGVYPTNDSV